MEIDFKLINCDSLNDYIEELGRLRIQVFREFPYIYDGDLEYEKKYLQRYIRSEKSLVILAMHENKIIGASTCLPLSEEDNEFQKPFLQQGYDLDTIFYFGESIILKEYRGNKLGHKFFQFREDHAKKTLDNLKLTTFCAVQRPSDHPLKPEGYRDLSAFWTRQGYEKTNMKMQYPWKDLDKHKEDIKDLVFWVKNHHQ